MISIAMALSASIVVLVSSAAAAAAVQPAEVTLNWVSHSGGAALLAGSGFTNSSRVRLTPGGLRGDVAPAVPDA
eukprot:SAG22_NODE_12138_length_455_cov_0.713483_1_plen_73_part_01